MFVLLFLQILKQGTIETQYRFASLAIPQIALQASRQKSKIKPTSEEKETLWKIYGLRSFRDKSFKKTATKNFRTLSGMMFYLLKTRSEAHFQRRLMKIHKQLLSENKIVVMKKLWTENSVLRFLTFCAVLWKAHKPGFPRKTQN